MQLPLLSALHASEDKLVAAVHGICSIPMASSPNSPLTSTLNLPSSGTVPLVSVFRHVEKLPGHLHSIHVIHFVNDTRLVVKSSPPSRIPLLRHESAQLSTEAAVLKLLAQSSLPTAELLRYELVEADVGPSFLLTVHLSGISYAAIRHDLTRSERVEIEGEIDSFRDVITQHQSPTFGSVDRSTGGRSFETWEEAFTAMMEDVLMDGEDLLVALPFTDIRQLVRRMGPLFRDVGPARLVVRGLGQEQNVMIDRQSKKVTGIVDLGSAFWGDGEWAERKGDRGIL